MNQQKWMLKLKKASQSAQKKDYIGSIRLCRELLKKSPENIPAQKLLATNFIALNRYDEVETTLKKVINLVSEQESYPLLHLLGCNYISQSNNEKAINVLEGVFNKTGNSKALLDIALAYANLGEYEAARDVYLKLIELEPDNHQAKFNLYPILLHFKDYKNAWVCFHSRLERQEIKDQVHWFAPPWNGESITGKNILIYPEQGIGDNLAYTGCFAEAIADAKETSIVCDNRLKGLYKHNFPNATIHSYDDVNREQVIKGDFDCQILAGSLPYFYRLDDEAFSNEPKLQVSEELQQAKASRLSGKKLKVGISWFHGRVNDGNANSMYLEELLPLLKMENIEWVNLQFGEWQPEVDKLQRKYDIEITHFEDCSAAGDFEHYAALIASLDLVISASNAALMLASRLGVKSWVFLPIAQKLLQSDGFNDAMARKQERRFYRNNDEGWEGVIATMCDEIKLL
jgi:hypothetical protein